MSSTESEEIARHFAGRDGRTWKTWVQTAKAASVGHRSLTELLDILRGKGKGDAIWDSAYEVQQAHAYAEQWLEHLLDFRGHKGKSEVTLVVRELFRGSKA